MFRKKDFKIGKSSASTSVCDKFNEIQLRESIIGETEDYTIHLVQCRFNNTLFVVKKQSGKRICISDSCTNKAVVFENKIFWYEDRSILSDKYIYRCNVNGTNIERLNILNNKPERANIISGMDIHMTSIDKVKEMSIIDNKLIILVERCEGVETEDNIKYYNIIFNTPDGHPQIPDEFFKVERNRFPLSFRPEIVIVEVQGKIYFPSDYLD